MDAVAGAPGQRDEFDGGISFGGYILLRKIGTGGMGQVWKAQEQYPRRIVALKLIKPQLFAHKSPEERARTVRRFRLEIETAAQLEHPNIVPLYHAGEEEGRLYYTMQYVEGRNPLLILQGCRPTVVQQDTPNNQSDTSHDDATKRPFARRRTETPAVTVASDSQREQWKRAARYVAQASRGLSYAHNRGFIHRDVKPDNIIVDQASDTARVTDFGLAKVLRESTDEEVPADYRAGTLGFMAPEQSLRAGTATVQSDIYGLGATLLALLTGSPPRQAGEENDPFSRICSTQGCVVHVDLQAICLKCLQKEPDRRYSSSSELADDLQRFLELRPVSARPVRRVERLRYWARRSPALAFVGLVTTILGLVVAIGGPTAAYFYLAAVHTAEIERQNKTIEAMEKQRALEESRRTQASLYYQEAQNARQRGDWRGVIKSLKAAGDAGHPDRVLLEIGQARARRSLGETPEWIEAVERLADQAESANHRGTILLMQGDVARFQGRSEQSAELTRRAIEAGLPLIDELYAQAISAETTPECVDLLSKAVAREPYHYDATMMLVAALVLSGQGHEARQRAQIAETLFPEDAGFTLWMAVLAAAESNTEEVERQMEKVGQGLDQETKALVFQALRNLQGFCDNFNHMELDKQNRVKMMWNFASLALAIRKLYGNAGEKNASLVSATSSLPRAYRQAYAPLFELSPTNVVALLGPGTSRYIDRLQQAVKRHPEGTLFMMQGSLLSEASRYAEAERAFAAAADAPAIIPGVNLEAPMLAAAAANLQYWESNQDPACLKRAVGYVRRRVRAGPSPPFQSELLLRIANIAGDDGLAQTIIWQVLDQYDDDVQWLLTVATNYLQHDRLADALRALDQALALEPDNIKANAMREKLMGAKARTATDVP